MCAATKGNQFWKLRSQHGREKLFSTPDLLWEAATEYFDWCDKTPHLKKDFKGKEVETVYYELTRPYTLSGLCLYLGVNQAYFRQFKSSLKDSKEENAEDFSTVITRIEETIYTQKFEGAAIGVFSSNIISRDLGLVDKKEQDTRVSIEQITGMTIKK